MSSIPSELTRQKPSATSDGAVFKRPAIAVHALRALRAIAGREIVRFLRQTSRLLSAVVRPTLWLVVFAAGFHHVLGVSIVPPYDSYITYREYLVPGLLGIVLLFNGMLSSLSLVYDREMGVMRLVLTAPLPRWYLLLCKLLAGTFLSMVQCYVFLLVALAFGVTLPAWSWLALIPATFLSGAMLGAVGLLLSVHIRQLENFAGAMNFVIFPMFFLSTALYPLWKLKESGAVWLWWLAEFNPFTHAVELIRFSAYGKWNLVSLAVVVGVAVLAFLAAAAAYDPQHGLVRRKPQAK
ncbi:MAG TPA: ABC transporter permease [Pararhizobium sp.]|nr:ABC transporter permease [Pararhizobium sp.]